MEINIWKQNITHLQRETSSKPPWLCSKRQFSKDSATSEMAGGEATGNKDTRFTVPNKSTMGYNAACDRNGRSKTSARSKRARYWKT